MKVAVTGAAGFIGSNFCHLLARERADWPMVALDSLTYAGRRRNLAPLDGRSNFCFVQQDVRDPAIGAELAGCDAVVHFAAETHVDRSLEDPNAFFSTNVEGTRNLLRAAAAAGVRRFIHIGTDEVYGSLDSGKSVESSPLNPTSPYARSKAEADRLVLEAAAVGAIEAIVTRCTNNYGPLQFPEKFIPLLIVKALAGEPLPIYGDGRNVRDWIHVEDHCRAVLTALEHGSAGQVYNVSADCELPNIEVALRILALTGRPESLLHFIGDRPAHDRRYALDSSRLRTSLGWRPQWNFDAGLAATVEWYRGQSEWIAEVCGAEYRRFLERHYSRREEFLRDLRR
jgi:dTDP-glucose 4,6-dehydratase